ncbi:MAG TPA: FAD-linked oxidase C-terminal domain-containing protein [Opitutus sp.]|nr:FAD-linked oxidase C-terminal domain-containing protein [Opitutus sp.]
MSVSVDFSSLAPQLEGGLHTGRAVRLLYATDASEYQELPAAVAFPRSDAHVRALVRFARAQGIGLIPRAAGTSLAGQVVGRGIVVDLGRHMNRIVAIDAAARRVRVQPGVVRNELNLALQPHGLLFGPETSTASRAMLGGMVGNNSCGTNSIVHGSTRDHLVSARGFLSDGSEATFGPLTPKEFAAKCAGPDTLETRIYREVRDLLGDVANRRLIRENFPKPEVVRRNTGYALDALMDCAVFEPASDRPFNLCRLIAGSEGTLFLGVEFEFNCEPLPPPPALLCVHCATLDEALRAVLIALPHRPSAAEVIDRHLLEATRRNLEQARNRFFVEGDPGGILVVELRRAQRREAVAEFQAIERELRAAGIGYAFPVLWDDDVNRVWDLRRAGQGVMMNIPGDAKPRENVEDTAVAPADLPAYIREFDALMRGKYAIECVYYGHAGAGELHTRPLFNLKTAEGRRMFRAIATDIAALVKKYRGSLSGEHGDGRLRGEFIPFMVGDACYAMMRRVKAAFDPANIFNPGKIIDTPPMDTSLRHGPETPAPEYATIFDFSATGGLLRAAEKCNGSGDCRKSHLMGGTMCPSYMATRDEKDTTRARANLLRHLLTHPLDAKQPWASREIAGVMDLCLSCKGCKSECPSNVDMARLKAEWQQHYLDACGVPLRSRLFASFSRLAALGSLAPALHNAIVAPGPVGRWLKRRLGIAKQRSLPVLPATTLRRWHARRAGRQLAGAHPEPARASSLPTPATNRDLPPRRVHLFCDEFTNFHDAGIGIQAVELLERLGYEVVLPPHADSGRAQLSKGFVRDARKLAIRNVERLAPVVSEEAPLVGLEPSAILGFRDEFPDLVPARLKPAAAALAKHALLFEEFVAREAERGRITAAAFTAAPRRIKLHGHCHQKALSSLAPAVRALELPAHYRVEIIPSGCCGMAGSFGYEAEHFAISQQIGELVLFPAVRSTPDDTLIAAAGTSCRHQIKDATGRRALHPAEILHAALAG